MRVDMWKSTFLPIRQVNIIRLLITFKLHYRFFPTSYLCLLHEQNLGEFHWRAHYWQKALCMESKYHRKVGRLNLTEIVLMKDKGPAALPKSASQRWLWKCMKWGHFLEKLVSIKYCETDFGWIYYRKAISSIWWKSSHHPTRYGVLIPLDLQENPPPWCLPH